MAQDIFLKRCQAAAFQFHAPYPSCREQQIDIGHPGDIGPEPVGDEPALKDVDIEAFPVERNKALPSRDQLLQFSQHCGFFIVIAHEILSYYETAVFEKAGPDQECDGPRPSGQPCGFRIEIQQLIGLKAVTIGTAKYCKRFTAYSGCSADPAAAMYASGMI